jgi:hypothetical protein
MPALAEEAMMSGKCGAAALKAALGLSLLALLSPLAAQAQGVQRALPPAWTPPPKGDPTFFVTSVGLGKGADLGGLGGADAHCQALAAAAGMGGHTWRAYLSTQAEPGRPAVNARDRIGAGPWFNAKGVRVATNLGDLHGDSLEQARQGNLIAQATALTEKGDTLPGEGQKPNVHDILTGTRIDGRAYTDNVDRTCSNWTSSAAVGSAQVGHADRNTRSTGISWNSSHETLGCSQEKLVSTGGAGLFYCFAAEARR